jgi:hypothetical protein
MEMQIINWLQDWYINQCDGEWEHDEGIRIFSSDNPGWIVKINVKGTEADNFEVPWKLIETSEQDWYGYKIEDGLYYASGDATKLSLLLLIFKSIIIERKAIPVFLEKYFI